MEKKTGENPNLELVEKLEKRIDDVETSIKKFTKQIMILMSELESPFAITKEDSKKSD